MVNTRLTGILIVMVGFGLTSSCSTPDDPTLLPDGEAGEISQPEVVPATELPPPSMTVTVPLPPAPWLEDATIYTDERVGFQLAIPPGWWIQETQPEIIEQATNYSTTATSWKPEEAGSMGIPEGGSKIDIYVRKEGFNTLEEAIDSRRQEIERADPDSTLLSEGSWMVNGIPVMRLQFDGKFSEAAEVVMVINDHLIIIGGLGDFELFDQIVSTIRPLSP